MPTKFLPLSPEFCAASAQPRAIVAGTSRIVSGRSGDRRAAAAALVAAIVAATACASGDGNDGAIPRPNDDGGPASATGGGGGRGEPVGSAGDRGGQGGFAGSGTGQGGAGQGGAAAGAGQGDASAEVNGESGTTSGRDAGAVDGGARPSSGVACAGPGAAVNPAPWDKLVGWATIAEGAVSGVTGGGSATPVNATSMAELQMLASGTAPAVIRVTGKLSGDAILEGANKTIIGAPGSELHGQVTLKRASNFILRNLTVVGDNCADKAECTSGTDALSVTFASHHLWFDHCDISDASDGNLDIKDGSDLITISWTKFHYSTPGRAHRFSSLIGHSDSATAAKDDEGKLRVTLHHNWWADNVFERMPRVRFGQVHVFNNLYTAAGNNYCVRAGYQADIRSEHNAFVGVNNPFDLEDATGKLQSFDDLFQQVKGTTAGAGTAFKPPYAYTMESACTVASSVRANAGPK